MRIFRSLIIVHCLLFIGSLVSLAEEAPVFYGDEVVVTATKTPQFKAELPYSVSVITSEEIETFGARNLGDVLQYTFSTYPKTKGFLGAENSASIRGGSYQQTLILIDGERVNSPLLGGADIGDITAGNIERVEIVRGPGSAIYGADAVGGVVNVITKKRGRGIEIYPQLSEMGASNIRLSFCGDASDAGYVMSVNSQSSPGTRTNSDYSSLNYSGNLEFRPTEMLKLGLGFNSYDSKRGVPGSLTFPTPNTRQLDNNGQLRISSEIKLSSLSDLKVDCSLNQADQLYSADPKTIPYDRYGSDTSIIGAQNDISLTDNDLLTCGLELREDHSESALSGAHEVENRAAFLEDEHNFNSALSLNLSGRLDSHSVYGDSGSPRLGMVYSPFEGLSFKVSYGEAFRAPTLNDLYTYYFDPVWGMIMRGNPSLKPERSVNSEVGVSYDLFGRAEVSLNYFSNRVTNLIDWVDISGVGMTWEAQNVSSASISGIELGGAYYLSKALKIFINCTDMAATDNSTGKDLVYRPRLQGNLGLQYNDEDDNSAGVFLRYVGDRYDDNNNLRKVPSYTVLDLRLTKALSGSAALSFGADNFFNETYQDTYDYPMPGRCYTFGVRYNLI